MDPGETFLTLCLQKVQYNNKHYFSFSTIRIRIKNILTINEIEIIERMVHPEWFFYKCFRPPVSQLDCKDYIIRCMQECWHETPEMRPDFKSVRGRLKEMEAGL